LLAGWERSANFELALDDWAEFGLSRFSASRGLDKLERAGLVSAARTPGRSPVVTILDVGVGPGIDLVLEGADRVPLTVLGAEPA
jgi:hypothetical protein